MVAVAVVVKGHAGVGDGFAGGLIAALALVIQYLALGPRATERWLPARRAPQIAFAGLLLALVVAAQSLLRGKPLLTHWPPPGRQPARAGTIELITAFAFDIAIFILVLGGALAVVHALARVAEEGEAP